MHPFSSEEPLTCCSFFQLFLGLLCSLPSEPWCRWSCFLLLHPLCNVLECLSALPCWELSDLFATPCIQCHHRSRSLHYLPSMPMFSDCLWWKPFLSLLFGLKLLSGVVWLLGQKYMTGLQCQGRPGSSVLWEPLVCLLCCFSQFPEYNCSSLPQGHCTWHPPRTLFRYSSSFAPSAFLHPRFLAEDSLSCKTFPKFFQLVEFLWMSTSRTLPCAPIPSQWRC